MKKIIVFLFVLVWFVWFGFSNLSNLECNSKPLTPWCPMWQEAMRSKCIDGWWVASINLDDCNCTIFPWTQSQKILPCDQVKSLVDVALEAASCVGWTILKDWKCCPLWNIPYDKTLIWSELTKCCGGILYDSKKKCCEFWRTIIIDGKKKESCVSCEAISADDVSKLSPSWIKNCIWLCESSKIYQLDNWLNGCCPWMVVKDDKDSEKKVCIINTEWNLWINMNSQCLINWQCSYNIYETLWIRKSDQNPQVKTFVQDIILAVTMFLGTVIAIILVISGILYIMAAISWKSSMADMAKKGIINSMIWLLLVTWSYALVRLIQFVATAWWW